jgi:hypothetical protein
MENLNLNVDSKTLEQCLKEISNWGGTTYQNICDGTSKFVPWGSVDYFWYLTLGIAGIVVVGLFVALIVMMIKMALDF